MSIRVLLGIGDPELTAAFRMQINELSDVEIVGVETLSADVVGAVAENPGLDAVLVHQEIGALPALELIRELVFRNPRLALVLIAEEATPEIYSAAMAAGARAVVSREATLAELQSRIGSAAEWSRSMRRHFDAGSDVGLPQRLGTMTAVCGPKGGTGTTTLAIHLAFTAARANKTVCLVDMDLQKGDIPSYLDITHRRSIVDLVPASEDLDGTILAEALYVHPAGPHILLGPAEGERGEDVTARAARQILAVLRSRYDVVIVDCSAYMTEGNAMAVELADRVIVTATPDLPCLRAVKRLSRLWGRLQIRKQDDLAVVLVRHDKRNEVQPDFARKVLGVPMLRSVIPAAFRALEEAANTGSPMAVVNADFRKAVSAVAREVGLLDPPAQKAVRRGDQGAALMEFAWIVPLLGLVLLLAWQAILAGLTSMYASHAANEGARAAAVLGTGAQGEIRNRAIQRVGDPWNDARHFNLAIAGDSVRVTIDMPVVLPGWRTTYGISAESTIVPEEGGSP